MECMLFLSQDYGKILGTNTMAYLNVDIAVAGRVTFMVLVRIYCMYVDVRIYVCVYVCTYIQYTPN